MTSFRGLPPAPSGENPQDLYTWALRMFEFLTSRFPAEGEVAPGPVLLQHQTGTPLERADFDGILMWDPIRQQVVYSDDGIWKTFGSTGSLSYLVTDDAGNGTVVDDINNTDFTGQQGAIGACAQCPVGTDVSFFHKGVQYIYAGPKPASYGLGCADTMQDSYLIPSGVGSFIALNDTPVTYSGNGNKWPRVNPGETALIFDDVEWGDILNKPATYPPSPHTHVEADITDLDRIRWIDPYTPGSSRERNDMVRDGVWTMIANKPTTDRPVTEDEDPFWVGDGAAIVPRGTENQSTYWTGQKYTWPSGGYFEGYRIDPPVRSASFEYSVIARVTLPDGTVGAADQILAWQTFGGTPGDWITVASPAALWLPGTTVEVFLGVRAVTQSNTFTANWAVKNIDGDPSAGEAWFQNNQTEIRVNDEDALGADQGDNLTAVQPGGTLQFAGSEWTITSVTDNGDFVTYGVTPAQGRPSEDERSLTFTWGSTDPLPINSDATFWAGNANIRGIEGVDINAQIETDSQFPIDLLLRGVTISPDWDLVAYSGAGGGGGGGGGEPGVTQFKALIDTPDSYVGQANKSVVVKQDEQGLEFVDPDVGSKTFVGLTDTPNSYAGQAGKLSAVKSTEDGLEFIDAPNGGNGPYFEEFHDPTGVASYRIVGTTLECWGESEQVAGDRTINLPKTYARADYSVSFSVNRRGDQTPQPVVGMNQPRLVDSFSFRVNDTNGFAITELARWYTIGELYVPPPVADLTIVSATQIDADTVEVEYTIDMASDVDVVIADDALPNPGAGDFGDATPGYVDQGTVNLTGVGNVELDVVGDWNQNVKLSGLPANGQDADVATSPTFALSTVPAFAEERVQANAATYLRATSTPADDTRILWFVRIEPLAVAREYLFSFNSANSCLCAPYNFGSGFPGAEQRLYLNAAGNNIGASGGSYTFDDYVNTAGDVLDYLCAMSFDADVGGVSAKVMVSRNGGAPELITSAATLTNGPAFHFFDEGQFPAIFARNRASASNFYSGVVSRMAFWTGVAPDVETQAVQDNFFSGGNLIDPSVSQAAYGQPQFDFYKLAHFNLTEPPDGALSWNKIGSDFGLAT